MSDTLITSSSN